jgi:recombinational DNA repair protein (RecF pathway)
MENCIKCGKKLALEKNYFSADAGGVFCQKCASTTNTKIGINSATIKLIRLFEKNKIESLVKLAVSKDDIRNAKAIAGEMVRWVV